METQSSQTTLPPILISVKEAARLLSLGRSTIYELIASNALPSVHIGNARRIPLAALYAWVNDQIAPSPSDAADNGA